MNAYEAARLIDISAVRTHHGLKDIQEVVDIAKKYKFINVHALPSWTKTVAELLKDEPDIYVGGPAGFPGGGYCTEIKVMEEIHTAGVSGDPSDGKIFSYEIRYAVRSRTGENGYDSQESEFI